MYDQHGEQNAEGRADGEAEDGLLQSYDRVIDEAALRGRVHTEDRTVEFGDDLVGRRQFRPVRAE